MLLCLRQQGITGLFGITKQHVSILFEENWIVHGSIANAKRSLHYYDLLKMRAKCKITLYGHVMLYIK